MARAPKEKIYRRGRKPNCSKKRIFEHSQTLDLSNCQTVVSINAQLMHLFTRLHKFDILLLTIMILSVKNLRKLSLFGAALMLSSAVFAFNKKKVVTVSIPQSAHERIEFGAQKLIDALNSNGYKTKIVRTDKYKPAKNTIYIGAAADNLYKVNNIESINTNKSKVSKEGFVIASPNEDNTYIYGSDYNGGLYGVLELADRIKEGKTPNVDAVIADQPEMVLRGTCIGVQKTFYLPGRHVYEYPYTEETFPWLYDKGLWIKYLDSLVENRYNSLYLWNGHPFASLVKLKDYPYALEVDEATFKKNEELYSFLTTEANKRGIWVIQMFYNIILSKPFAEHHGIKTQERERKITPLISDYTRKSIAAFVEKYPNVGLLVTLGEAMEGVGQDDIDWFNKTILPGVQDGLKALGTTVEPPIVLRAHDTDAPAVMAEALKIYKNLYTMAKYNGEALTTYTPRGTWAKLHRDLSAAGTVHVENVHLLSNLEPFRYASADFIQKSIHAMHDSMHANALHLYPQASYWDWPYSADKLPNGERLLQIDRDWLWYRQWARYAWKANREKADENAYWSKLIGKEFAATEATGSHILKAYEETGEIAPKLLRRFGITDGNRQTLNLGMQMTQLINPYRYGLFTLLYESEAPLGEPLYEYAEKAFKGIKHVGETPVHVIDDVRRHAAEAVKAIDKATPGINQNKDEYNRIKNDIYIYEALAQTFAFKAEAALKVLNYKYSNNIKDLDEALPLLKKSVEWYAKLTDLTKDSYLYANSMQTGQRKIPFRGQDGAMKNWYEILPHFQNEVTIFEKRIDSLKNVDPNANVLKAKPFVNAEVIVNSPAVATYTIAKGAKVYSDTSVIIKEFAPELEGLKGLLLSKKAQANGTEIEFTNKKAVKVVVGYYKKKAAAFTVDTEFLKAPELETNAYANDYGQADIKIANAIVLDGMPAIHLHTYTFQPGKNKLVLGKGAVLILGFINDSEPIKIYDANLNDPSVKNIDWLFE